MPADFPAALVSHGLLRPSISVVSRPSWVMWRARFSIDLIREVSAIFESLQVCVRLTMRFGFDADERACRGYTKQLEQVSSRCS
jgi:hypothetical protein